MSSNNPKIPTSRSTENLEGKRTRTPILERLRPRQSVQRLTSRPTQQVSHESPSADNQIRDRSASLSLRSMLGTGINPRPDLENTPVISTFPNFPSIFDPPNPPSFRPTPLSPVAPIRTHDEEQHDEDDLYLNPEPISHSHNNNNRESPNPPRPLPTIPTPPPPSSHHSYHSFHSHHTPPRNFPILPMHAPMFPTHFPPPPSPPPPPPTPPEPLNLFPQRDREPQIVYIQSTEEGPKLKEPDTFSGRDPAKLTPFITQCYHWFLAKPKRYESGRDRVLFAASYLRDLANTWWMPIISETPHPPILDDWNLFTKELFLMFGNQHLQATAQNNLLNIKMKDTGKVSEYLVRFNSHAPYTGWNDTALTGHFYRGLPDRIKDMFQLIQRPQTFTSMRQHALEFDQRYWERQEELGNRPYRPSDKPRTTPNNPRPYNSPPQNKPSASSSSAPNSSTTAKDNSNSNSRNPRSKPRGPLSEEEKQRRRNENLCLYCAGKNHKTPDCPHTPTNRKPQTGRATFTFTTKADEPSIKEVDSENDSETLRFPESF